MNILFVCTGNTCRSPMAEYLARKYYNSNTYFSAGLSALSGQSASSDAINAMKSYDIDLSSHTAQELSFELTQKCDYIVPMTSSHKHTLLMLGIDKNKILSFCEEISDPYMCDETVYLNCAKQIKKNLDMLFGENNDN